MAIDFTLTSEQTAIRKTAREFAQRVLSPISRAADAEPDAQKAFEMTKSAYVEAYKLGLATCFVPTAYGGLGLSHVDYMIAAEEICAVDPGFACTLLVNGLALMPLVWFGSEEQKNKWLGDATRDPTGEFLAGWCVSEPNGTANFDHRGPLPTGVNVVATYDAGRDEYIINGTKYWPSNAGGWDLNGANINIVTVRLERSKGGKESLACAIVERGTPGLRFNPPIQKVGHRLEQNNWMEFNCCRVPAANIFAVGRGAFAIAKAFTWSGPVAGIAAVGVARSAYEWSLVSVRRLGALGELVSPGAGASS